MKKRPEWDKDASAQIWMVDWDCSIECWKQKVMNTGCMSPLCSIHSDVRGPHPWLTTEKAAETPDIPKAPRTGRTESIMSISSLWTYTYLPWNSSPKCPRVGMVSPSGCHLPPSPPCSSLLFLQKKDMTPSPPEMLPACFVSRAPNQLSNHECCWPLSPGSRTPPPHLILQRHRYQSQLCFIFNRYSHSQFVYFFLMNCILKIIVIGIQYRRQW